MTISKADFWYLITELVTRNSSLGIPALEDGLFANFLIFDYLYYIFVFGKGSEGKGKGKGKRERKMRANIKNKMVMTRAPRHPPGSDFG